MTVTVVGIIYIICNFLIVILLGGFVLAVCVMMCFNQVCRRDQNNNERVRMSLEEI
jgi:hypothetical protein